MVKSTKRNGTACKIKNEKKNKKEWQINGRMLFFLYQHNIKVKQHGKNYERIF